MVKYAGLGIAVLVGMMCVHGQDDESGAINTYNEGGSSFGASAPAKPEKKKSAAPARNAPVVKSSDESDNAPASAGGEDEQYIQSDDYFVADEALGSQSWIWVSLSKMTIPPSSSSKNEAEMMKIRDGNKVWTKYYHKTVVARKADLKLGTVVVAFNDNNRDDIYMAPDSKESSRGGAWFMGKVIDMTDLFKGYVTVAGNYKVSPKNLRVIVK